MPKAFPEDISMSFLVTLATFNSFYQSFMAIAIRSHVKMN